VTHAHNRGGHHAVLHVNRSRAQPEKAGARSTRGAHVIHLKGLARAFAGALIFALPMLMTMEMWWLGFIISPWRLLVLTLLWLPLLVAVSHFAGFEDTFGWREDVRDALIGYLVGVAAATMVLSLFTIISPRTPFNEILGKLALQAVPASLGALLARTQMGAKADHDEEERRATEAGYGGELFIMAVGALFLCLTVAPTEEMILIAHMMQRWHAIVLAVVSLLLMQAFVYSAHFAGGASLRSYGHWWSEFVRLTAPGYAIALLISLYVLWTFGRTDDTGFGEVLGMAIVLGFPAALGAAGARLIL
jgi:putative integral membrane protein (TIGR02587 family)